jgi:hypothetical protein
MGNVFRGYLVTSVLQVQKLQRISTGSRVESHSRVFMPVDLEILQLVDVWRDGFGEVLAPCDIVCTVRGHCVTVPSHRARVRTRYTRPSYTAVSPVPVSNP